MIQLTVRRPRSRRHSAGRPRADRHVAPAAIAGGRAGRRRLARRRPDRLRAGRRARGRADRRPTGGSRPSTPGRATTSPIPASGGCAPPRVGGTYLLARRARAWPRCASPLGWRYRVALGGVPRRLRLDRAHRRHHLPEPLLVRDPVRRSCCSRSRPRHAGRSTPVAGRRAAAVPARRGVAAARPGRRRLRVRRAGQAPRRLAGARPPAAALAPGPIRPARSSGRGSTSRGSPSARAGPARCSTASSCPRCCWRRTRPFAWCALVVFHVVTWRLFPIGVFPWLMIAASTVFFEPGLAASRCSPVSDCDAAPTGPRRGSPDAAIDRRGRSRVSSVARRRALGRGAGARPVAAPRDSRRLPVDQRGVPLRLGCAPHREGGRRHLPRDRSGRRDHLDRDRPRRSTPRRSGG